nr:transmembrane protein 184C-like [Ipomoea batatas]
MAGVNLTMTACTVCLVLTLHFTIRLVSQHLSAWKKPKEQKAILIIILMAPLYAVVSYVGLVDFLGSNTFFTFLESVKECYEALPHTAHLNHHTLKLLKDWTWQFVLIRPVCSVLMIALQLLGMYPTWVSWIFTIILNISVSLALYSLVVFYHVFAKELAPHKPLAKFLCVKGIVFFCFWQGIALEILVALGIIKSHHVWFDVEHIQEALQNMLVIVEMVLFSIVQQHAYTAEPYRKENKKD